MDNHPPSPELAADEIDLSALFAVLWRQRKLIVLGTLAVTLLAVGMSLLIPRVYQSNGFYQLGSAVSIPIYKTSASMFSNPNRFVGYANREKSFSDPEKRTVSRRFQTARAIQKWIQPVYAFSKEDQRELALIGKEDGNSVLGLNLTFEGKSPEFAARMVTFFGHYVRDCLMYVTLFNYISENVNTARTSLQKNENALIANRFALEQQQKKMVDIQQILRKYPDSAKIDNRQLVSIQEGGARFLSPVTQLVGIESTVADLRREVALLEREREKILPLVEFFDRAKVALDQAGEQGEPLFQAIKTIHKDLFAGKDLSRDTLREVFNNLSVEQQNFDRTFNTSYRFVSGPTVPARHIKPSRSKIVLIAFFLAGFFFVCLAFLLSWWQHNKQAILNQ